MKEGRKAVGCGLGRYVGADPKLCKESEARKQ